MVIVTNNCGIITKFVAKYKIVYKQPPNKRLRV